MITPESAERLQKVMRTVEAHHPVVTRGDDTALPPFVESAPVVNTSGLAVPQYGIVWLGATASDGYSRNASQIEYPGVTMFGVATAAIPAGAPGRAWISGVHPVLCSNYAAMPLGTRLSTQAASWFALRAALGLMLLVGTVPGIDQPGGLPGGVGLVRARIDRGRPF